MLTLHAIITLQTRKGVVTMITHTELVEVAETFLAENFGLGLNVPLEINNRLTSTLGKVTVETNRRTREHNPIRISLSGRMIKYASRECVIDTLKHECIHYALVLKKLPFLDSDTMFIETCKSLNVSLSHTVFVTYLHECSHCKEEFNLPTYKKVYTHTTCNDARVTYIRPTYLTGK